MSGVPIIDIGPFLEDSKEGKEAVAREIGHACREIGFFIVKNHGVPAGVIRDMWAATASYFDLPVSIKREVPMTDDYPYGYSGFEEEVLSKSEGTERPGDLKECFAIGPDNPKATQYPRKWHSNSDEMRKVWEKYYEEINELARRILRIFALALDLEENWFEGKIDHHNSALRALNYPETEKPPRPGQLRASEHTDYGSITILKSGGPGLQVLGRDGNYLDVEIGSDDDVFVINLGDLMQMWTNDQWRSTKHRVVCTGDHSKRRQSIAFFHNINSDQLVECIPTCATEETPAKYEPITAGEHLMRKHGAAVSKKY